MKKQMLMLLSVGSLLLGTGLTSHSEALVLGCIAPEGDQCEPPRYGREPQPYPEPLAHHESGRPPRAGVPEDGRPPRAGVPEDPGHPGYPDHPVRPDDPTYSFELHIPLNDWTYGYQRLSLNHLIDLRPYRGYRILEVSVVARAIRGYQGNLELLLNGQQVSTQRVTYRDPFQYRLPVWGYRTIGRDVRWLEIGTENVHLIDARIRLSRK